jgi:hypothetical protein
MRYTIANSSELPGWDDFVRQHPKGTIFHTKEMVQVLAATKLYEPLAIAACAPGGRIVAVLVAARVCTIPGMLSRFAARSILFAEPLCTDDSDGIAGLTELIKHHDRQMQSQTLFCEVRPIGAPGPERTALVRCGYQWHDYLNYVTDVTISRDKLWRQISKCCRRDIRRSHERGVVLKEENSPAGIQKLYDYIEVSYARSKVPAPDQSLFDATLAHLPPEWYRVVIAYYENQPIASSIDLVYGGMVYGWYGGTLRVPGIAANACITWNSIEWAADNGQQMYDFGGAGLPDTPYSPRDFKSKFGGQLVHYGRYRKVYSRWRLALAERAYSRARRFIAPAGRARKTTIGLDLLRNNPAKLL